MLQSEISAALKRAIQMHQTGAVSQAEHVYREILATDRNVADAWNMLAVALCQQQHFDEAVQAAKRATDLRPNIAPYWLTRGNIAVEQHNDSEAQSSFRRAIKLDPNFAEAHYWLARSYHRTGRFMDAIAVYRAALKVTPEVAEIHYHLGRALLSADRAAEALDAYQQAFTRDSQGTFDRRECFDHFRFLEFQKPLDFWHAELIRFFRRKDIDKSRYAVAGLRVLMGNPAFRAVSAAAETEGQFDVDAGALEAIMDDELFGILLRDTLIAQPEFEILLTRLRARLLLDAELRSRAPLEFLCDLALQCFNNEFVFHETQAESEALAEAIAQIEKALHAERVVDEALIRLVATVATYRPLSEINGIDTLLAPHTANNAIVRLLHRSVTNVAEERKLRASIRVMGTIDDEISQAVRMQYEENPYPRWLSFDRMPPVSAAEWIQREVPGSENLADFPAAPRVLIAGCGTGVETLALATQIARSQVTAIDLSLSSLAYAQRMANELGIKNVEFFQADILKLGESINAFDIVYCVGVLMAIGDPEAGLRALVPLLRPGGLLKAGVYSKRARGAVNLAREMIRQQQLPATASAIRAFRQTIFSAKPDSRLRSLLSWRDFYSMSDCRDFLFHVQEYQFELPEFAGLLARNGLTVLGMSKQLPPSTLSAYQRTFPQNKTMTDLQNWHLVEQRYPDTFLGMYQVWCRKPLESRN
jgi:SAM-dependent methyltransferase/Tfp pilus assembly protein PilF